MERPHRPVRRRRRRARGVPVPRSPPGAGVSAAGRCGEPQNAQRLAGLGISLRHSVHGCVSESTSGWVLRLRITALTGSTTKKNTAAATETNVISAFRNDPYRKTLPLMVNVRL